MTDILNRVVATDKTVAKYSRATFKWGQRDCARMVAAHLRHMGHNPGLAKARSYSNELGALRALKELGFDSLEAALDARFERIAPSAALPGDIISMDSDGQLSALAVRLSNNAVLHSLQGGFAVSVPLAFKAAWRVPCLRAAKMEPL